MATYPIAPGAWLSGRGGVANTPIERRRAANTPIEAPRGANTPIEPPRGANTPIEAPGGSRHTPIGPDRNPPLRPGAVPSTAPFPLPWEGANPDWAYVDSDSLLGAALAKSRVKVVLRDPAELRDADLRFAALLGRRIGDTHLWRWAPEFRINAVQGDLLGRFQVVRGCVWLLGRAANGVPVPAQRVFAVEQQRGSQPFQRQIDKVQRAAVEREDRLPEILTQAADFWPFFESITGVQLDARPRLAEWLAVAHGVALHVLMSLKNNIGALRPVQSSTLVVPVIPTPGHGSLPSGHATMSALNAELLGALLYRDRSALSLRRREQMDRLARRIAFNRVVAGVHFPFDSLVGYALGTQLGRLLAALGNASPRWPGCVDDAELDRIDPDLELPETGGARPRLPPGGQDLGTEPSWSELWLRTRAECDAARI